MDRTSIYTSGMKILICPDSFKESISASIAGKQIRSGILKILPDASIKIIPMADGGEGIVDALIASIGGRRIKATAHDPLMRPISATYGIIRNHKTAVIEMAAASGLHLLDKHERNPVKTTSFGTGEMIKSALDHGCKKIILGLGGSATIDAGIGMAQALGITFRDNRAMITGKGGGSLNQIAKIDFSQIDPRLKTCNIIAVYDVTNTLTGKNGAAYVYGPQKGATPETVRLLDDNLRHLAGIIRESLHIDVENKPGSGAAGGLAAGLIAFLNASLEPGFDLIAQMVKLDHWIQWSELVITGEGKMDLQTTFGKVPCGVARIAKQLNKPVIAFTGYLDPEWNNRHHPEFVATIPLADKPMSLKQSMTNAGKLLENAAERTMQILKLGITR